MPPIEEYFASPVDGLWLFRQIWTPPAVSSPRAVIVFTHGMMEHSGRHADWAQHFAAEHNIAVVAADARGHGRSEGRRAWVRDFGDFLDDYAQVLCDAAQKFPGVPLFAMGFSMGGAIATLTALRRQALGLKPSENLETSCGQALQRWTNTGRRVEGRCFGKTKRIQNIPTLSGVILAAPAIRFRGKMFKPLCFAASVLDHFAPQIWVAKANYSLLSRNRELIASFNADPLVHHGVLLLHFGTEILGAMRSIQKLAPRFSLPLLMLQGTSDWVVTPSGAADFVAAASSSDKTLKLYDGLYHDLLHEPERDAVLADVLAWLAEH